RMAAGTYSFMSIQEPDGRMGRPDVFPFMLKLTPPALICRYAVSLPVPNAFREGGRERSFRGVLLTRIAQGSNPFFLSLIPSLEPIDSTQLSVFLFLLSAFFFPPSLAPFPLIT